MYRLAFKSAVPGFAAGHVIDVPFMIDDPHGAERRLWDGVRLD